MQSDDADDTATKRTTLLTLDSNSFKELFGSDANLLAEMQIKLLRNGCTLKSVLNHQGARPLFVKHIEGEFSGENIYFFDAVASYMPKTNTTNPTVLAALKAEARGIVEEYVLEGSNQQVNIPSAMCKKIAAWHASDGEASAVHDDMLAAQSEIYTLMARDNFPRFTKSEVRAASPQLALRRRAD